MRSTTRPLVLSLVVLCALGVASVARAADHHVSPKGTSSGDGSLTKPWDLATALGQPKSVVPGDTIWVHAGTYAGTFDSKLTGTSSAPIVVRAAAGERATIDGGTASFSGGLPALLVEGGYVWFWGLEITSSSPSTRTMTDVPGYEVSRPELIDVGNSGDVPGVKLIDLVLHDGAQGVGFWSGATDGELYGSLLYFNGFDAPDRGHGHATYMQNISGHGTKHVVDNIAFDGFANGIDAHGSSAAHVEDIVFEGNFAFGKTLSAVSGGSDFVVTGGRAVTGVIVRDNAFPDGVDLGEGYGVPMGDITLEGNVFGSGEVSKIANWPTITATKNTWVGPSTEIWIDDTVAGDPSKYAWDGNTYFSEEKPDPWGSWQVFFLLLPSGNSLTSFSDWRSKFGLDATSSYTKGKPTAATVIVRPNRYEKLRANIAVFNWLSQAEVDVDVSSVGLSKGDGFELRDAQDFYGAPVLKGTYDGGALHVPMTSTAIATPTGIVPKAPSHTDSTFGAFVLLGEPGAAPDAGVSDATPSSDAATTTDAGADARSSDAVGADAVVGDGGAAPGETVVQGCAWVGGSTSSSGLAFSILTMLGGFGLAARRRRRKA